MGRHPGLLPFGNSAFGTPHHTTPHHTTPHHTTQHHTHSRSAPSLPLPLQGLLLRICHKLFANLNTVGSLQSQVHVSFVELYNEKAYDQLLPGAHALRRRSKSGLNANSDDPGLRIREHPKSGPYVENLTRLQVFGGLEAFAEPSTTAPTHAATQLLRLTARFK